MVASDKLFFWLFQERSERLQPLVASVVDDMAGYGFSAPAIKELEVRLDGLFLPPPDQLTTKPALILEAQMASQPEFFSAPLQRKRLAVAPSAASGPAPAPLAGGRDLSLQGSCLR